MLQVLHEMFRAGRILWDCGLNVPPGEEGDTIFDYQVQFFCQGPNLPKMEEFSNKENYRAYRIWNMGWQDGDVELIMLDICFASTFVFCFPSILTSIYVVHTNPM